MTPSKIETLRRLTHEIKGLERNDLSDRQKSFISSSINCLDESLPSYGFPSGSLIELLADSGSGALLLALQMAKTALQKKPAWAMVTALTGEALFYAPAAAQRGFDTQKLILIQAHPADAIWAFNQLLRCPDVGASFFISRSMDNMTYRRLQLAAERGQNLGFILRPKEAIKRPCWAALRVLVENASAHTDSTTARTLKLTLLHVRGGTSGKTLSVDIDNETLPVPLPSALAAAAPAE